MPKVVVLAKDVADKIAAGEVVDRPASIVKELVENSIDAGASRISIELEEGGKRRITITDNGCGMLLEDAVLALERHATSKIRAAEDLFSIHTLGFRGEALPSIAAVSSLRILTRAESEETGVDLLVEHGSVTAAEQRGLPQGTQMTVTDLFANVPARLKFLKAAQTELTHITDMVARFALSYHAVSFKLIHNGRQVFVSQGAGDPLNTVVAVYGHEVARAMLPVASPEDASVAIRGYVSRPSVTRANRLHQSFFVNGRLVRSPLLSRALDEAYKGYLPQGRFPVACIFIQVDPDKVDVNVHPTKMEVRFAADREVFERTLHAVRMALGGANLAAPALTPLAPLPDRMEKSIAAQTIPAEEDPFAGDKIHEPAPQASYAATRPALSPAALLEGELRLRPAQPQATLPLPAPEPIPAPAMPASEVVPPAPDVPPAPAVVPPAPAVAPAAASAADTLPQLNPVARVLDTYVVCEGPDAVYLIDQHAAHERIIYEKLMRHDRDGVTPQQLLLPLTLSLSHADAVALEEYREQLGELGFEIEPFGRDTFMLRSVPMLLVGKNYAQVLQDALDDLRERDHTSRLEDQRAELCAVIACHSVTRSGDSLTREEMLRLVRDLRSTEGPYTCPHGRPTMLVFSRGELERKMGRA